MLVVIQKINQELNLNLSVRISIHTVQEVTAAFAFCISSSAK
jgi:hypothetical protein